MKKSSKELVQHTPDYEVVSGIYLIYYKRNRVYVGSSQDCLTRWKHHLWDLQANRHDNPPLQAAFNKYGSEKLVFELIEFCSQDDLLVKEQIYLDQYWGSCFNCNPKADKPPSRRGWRHSLATKKRLAKIATGRKHTAETKATIGYKNSQERSAQWGNFGSAHPRSKRVQQRCCISGDIVAQYGSTREAARQTGIAQPSISYACRGLRKSAGGYVWEYT